MPILPFEYWTKSVSENVMDGIHCNWIHLPVTDVTLLMWHWRSILSMATWGTCWGKIKDNYYTLSCLTIWGIHVTFIILKIQNPNTSIISFLSQTFHRNKGSSLVQINKTLNYEAEPSVTFFGHVTHLKVLQLCVVVYQNLREIGKCVCRRGTWGLIHKAHLRIWRKFWKFSHEIHSILLHKITIFTLKCQASITIADMKWKYELKIHFKYVILMSEILQKLKNFLK